MKRSTMKALNETIAEEAQRLAKFGPPPINPFTELRQRNDLTVQEFADRAGVSKQSIIRLEQGCFQEPLPKVLSYVLSNYPVSEFTLVNDYEDFQIQQRMRHPRYFGNVRVLLELDHPATEHPLRLLRGKRNLTEVAKDLCLSQATLAFFERRVKNQKSVPKQLLDVMRFIGHTKEERDVFEDHYRMYREGVLKRDRPS